MNPKNLVLSLFLTIYASAIFAQAAAPAFTKVTSVEGITEYKLKNGLKVLIFPDPSNATITVNITYLVGSRMEGYGETGMAHLLEHMAFKGSTHHTNVPQELTSHGARPNGTTSYDRTNYFETFSATDENLKWALDLESDRMVNSFIAEKDLRSEFTVVRNEFEMGENSPESILSERVMSTAYLWHNYGKSTIGSKEDIEKVPIANLQAFYKKYYQPDNAVLTVTGRIDEAKTIQLVSDYFGKIPAPTRKLQEPYTVEPTQDGERVVELNRVGDVQVVSCGYHIPSGSHVDMAPIKVLTEILINEPSGRLYKAMVESKKASEEYGYTNDLKDPGFVYFSADVLKEKSLSDARTAMMKTMDDLSTQPITAEEVERAKNKLLKNIDLLINNSSNLGLTLSNYIAKGDWRLFFIYRDRLDKVTADDVNRVAKAYFKPSNCTIGLFIPEQNPDRADIPAMPNIDSLTKNYKGRQALANAETFDPSPANIESKTKKGKIAGGARYAFLSKSTRGNSVSINITLRMGSEKSLEGKSKIANLTASMLNKGSKNKTRQQIADGFDKLKANVSIFGYGQSVSINVTTTRDNVNDVLALLHDVLRDPIFPEDEFSKLKDQDLADIEQERTDPQALAYNAYNRIVSPYPKSDFRYISTYEEEAGDIKSASLKEIKEFYNDYYNSGNATVAVVGDFDETGTLKGISDILANWDAKQKFEHAKKPFFTVQGKSDKIKTPDKKNAMLVAGSNLKLNDNDPDYPALAIGSFMTGGGFLNSRLAARIRQKEGISYGVGCYISGDALDTVGSFGAYAIYNPDNSDKLVAAFKEEIDKVLKDGFTAPELKDAISGYLQQQEVSRSQDRSLVNTLSNYLYLNRTMQWNAALEKKIAAITPDQVNTAMKKYLHPEDFVYIQAGDFKAVK